MDDNFIVESYLQRYWYLNPIEVIAERYGMSRSKVKSILFRVRKNLKNIWKRRAM